MIIEGRGLFMKINQLKAGAIISYISMLLGYIISIAYTPIMIRLLGQSEYGLYNLVASLVSYLGLLSFGFGSAYMRYYSRYKVNNDQHNIAKLNGMFLIVFSAIGFIAILSGLILVFNIEPILGKQLTMNELHTAKILMIIMVFNLALSFPVSIFKSYIMANEKFVFQNLLQMIKIVANPFIMLPILLMGYKSIGMVIVTTILTMSIDLANLIFCFKKLKIRFVFYQFDFSLMMEMTVFSSYIFLNMIIDQINWNVDKFILGRLYGTVTVAIYGLAAQLNTYYLSLSTAISNVFIPKVNRMVAAKNDSLELTSLFTRIGRIQFIVLALILSGMAIFGKPFIIMWAGVDYHEAYPIVLILMISATIPLIQNIGIEIQKAKNMHQFRSVVYFLIAIGNLFISIPLAKYYGGIGSAVGTAIAQIIGNIIIMNIYYSKKVGINIKYFWKEIFKFIPSLIVPTILGIIIYQTLDLFNIKVFIVAVLTYLITYIISMWLVGMNKFEKDLVRGPLMKMKLPIINK